MRLVLTEPGKKQKKTNKQNLSTQLDRPTTNQSNAVSDIF